MNIRYSLLPFLLQLINNNIETFFLLAMEKEKHSQPTMKSHMILSLITKQSVLITSETLY